MILKYREPTLILSRYIKENHSLIPCPSRGAKFDYISCVNRLKNGYEIYKYSYFSW